MRTHWGLRAACAVLPVAAVSALGSAATRPNLPVWYAGLAKPPLTPPNAVFAPVWSILFVLMAYAIWRILSLPTSTLGRLPAIGAFFLQLTLNCLWSSAFFGMRSPLFGLVVIAALLPAILLTIRLFWPLDRIAAWLLAPYAAWVSYATYLNCGILLLNR